MNLTHQMAQSLTQVYIHLIFSTKNRTQYLTPEIQNRLHPYLVGIARSLESPAVKVGGHYDHIHILFRLSKNKTLSEIIGKLKGESSRWLNKEAITSSHFAWQAGFGAFSVSQSQVDTVTQYIANQHEHHKKKSFQEELLEFLKKYEVDYDEKYLWT